MNKKIVLCVMLLVCALLFSACQSSNTTPYKPIDVGQNVFGGQQTSPSQGTQQGSAGAVTGQSQTHTSEEPDYDSGEYDPASEEDPSHLQISTIPEQVPTYTSAPAMSGGYAGATPLVIDPIDKPTPTPLPPLTFAYQVYDATNIGLTFEAPIGWSINTSQSDAYILTNPAGGMDYQAQIVIRAMPVDQQYNQKSLEQVVENMLDNTGSQGFRSYSPSRTATRTLMDAAGVYANYSGTLSSGAQVAGRIHATCINKTLYTVHVSYPKGYTETYKDNVYDHLRKTLSITR